MKKTLKDLGSLFQQEQEKLAPIKEASRDIISDPQIGDKSWGVILSIYYPQIDQLFKGEIVELTYKSVFEFNNFKKLWDWKCRQTQDLAAIFKSRDEAEAFFEQSLPIEKQLTSVRDNSCDSGNQRGWGKDEGFWR